MIGGLVEVSQSGRHLSVERGFLKVSEQGAEIGRVPLDDITAVILAGPQISLTKTLMMELAERGAVIVTCGRNWHPASFTLPFDSHFEAAGILHDQITASTPLRKRLWQAIVRTKIRNQALVLERYAPGHRALSDLAALGKRVGSGDPENREAQAARIYWPALMGTAFRRDRRIPDRNARLNYGYTVLRAAAARATCAAGLHPTLGLHHKSRVNPFALVDDLMEPFRPMVDASVRELADRSGELDPAEKRHLAAVLQADMVSATGLSPVVACLGRLAQSLTASLRDKTAALEIASVKPPGRLV